MVEVPQAVADAVCNFWLTKRQKGKNKDRPLLSRLQMEEDALKHEQKKKVYFFLLLSLPFPPLPLFCFSSLLSYFIIQSFIHLLLLSANTNLSFSFSSIFFLQRSAQVKNHHYHHPSIHFDLLLLLQRIQAGEEQTRLRELRRQMDRALIILDVLKKREMYKREYVRNLEEVHLLFSFSFFFLPCFSFLVVIINQIH